MKIIQFADYQKANDLTVLDGARWLLIHHSDLNAAAAVLFHTELLDILVGVDHRGARIIDGLWQRAVHLLLADSDHEQVDEQELVLRTGITRVVLDSTNEIEHYCY